MTLYAVNVDVYIEASGPKVAEAKAQDILYTALQWRKRIKHVAVGLSREADETEVE